MSRAAEDGQLSIEGPGGEEVTELVFASEALGMPAEEGYGWAQFKFGDVIGENSRYTIARKLGWGMHSSTWLARDNRAGKYVAVKALTGYMTKLVDEGAIWEPEALVAVTVPPSSPHCPRLLDQFTEPGLGSAGQHLCLVMPLYGGDVKALQAAEKKPFPLPLAKRILLHLLRGIAHAHERGVVHTDLKHDNIFFDTSLNTQDVEEWVAREPSCVHPPEQSHDGVVQAAISQPLPLISREEALQATFLVADFGCAQPSNLHDDRIITTPPLRAPEVYLRGKWDKPADIWSVGVLAYELFTARALVHYQINKKFALSAEENMLYQMLCCTGEDFEPEQLNISPMASEYFTEDCQLKKKPKLGDWPFEKSVAAWGNVDAADAPGMASFLRRCLRLDPMHRASASELLSDPLLFGVD